MDPTRPLRCKTLIPVTVFSTKTRIPGVCYEALFKAYGNVLIFGSNELHQNKCSTTFQ